MEQALYSHKPFLGGLEVLNASFEKHQFSKHTHEGYTLGLIRTGAQAFWRSGASHTAPANSVILVNADQVHDGHAASANGWTYDAIYPKPEQIERITHGLGASIVPFFPQAVERNERLARQFASLFDVLKYEADPLLQETLLFDTLLALSQNFGRYRRCLADVPLHRQGLIRVQELLETVPENDYALEQLAKLAGMSAYHFVRQFKQVFGLPPHAYQIQKRIQLAKQLLRDKLPIAEVASNTGFHDQSHFYRHFKRALGITPKRYQLASSGGC